MDRHRRLIRGGLVIAVAGAALTACAGDDSDEALQLAREACTVEYPDFSGDPLTDPAARQDARDKLVPPMEEAADKAAQAARLDDTWQPLATVFNRAAELGSVTIELGDLRDTRISGGYSDAADVDRDTRLDERRTELIEGMDEPSITGECRKTKSAS